VGTYGFLIFVILLAPTSSIIPIKDPIAERRLYLPMLGLVLVACEFMIHTVRQRVAAIAIAACVLAALSFTTYRRNQLWGSEAALWEDTIAKSPNKLRGYGHLMHGLISEHHCRQAIQRMEDLSRRTSIDPPLLGHWAVAYECVHEPEHAIAKLELAAAQAPSAMTYVAIARNQLELMRDQDALQSLDRAIESDPGFESAYVLRGELLERHSDLASAANDFRQALRLNPQNEQAQWRLRQITAYLHQ
jgi:tetratricopeptide (TPR) repeat protein